MLEYRLCYHGAVAVSTSAKVTMRPALSPGATKVALNVACAVHVNDGGSLSSTSFVARSLSYSRQCGLQSIGPQFNEVGIARFDVGSSESFLR
jgi:hypothetical protein